MTILCWSKTPEDEAIKQSGGKTLTRDADVLDTWFSSGLWPFSTLGWPDDTLELKKYYPTDLLYTGADIIFFWVARMIMMGMYVMGDVPFHTVNFHGLVLDSKCPRPKVMVQTHWIQ